MSSTNLSKEFFELIKAIGESKSKQEEDRIIQDEVRVLKTMLQESKVPARRMKEVLVRLIYVEMLGHDASWGYVVAVQQTATSDLSQKRAGYLACSLMLSPDHEFRFMLVNQMQRDLGSANVLECCAALIAVCKLVTSEMIPALLPRVAELLTHDQTLVRKKAVMALHRFFQLDAGSISHLAEQVKALLRDRDPSVMASALCLLHELARVDPSTQSDLVDQYVSILKQITEHRLPRDFDYHRMPAPWIQIKLLQLLATLGANDKRSSESMYEVLGECMKRADTGTNVGYAVVYEAVKTVTTIWPDSSLLDAAANSISRFVQSEAYNLKYLGVTGLAAIVRDHPKYAMQHQMAVIDCLDDPDETLKRKTLELLFRMTNPQNAEAVVDKLLFFLEQAVDPFLRTDLVTRIVQLADRYAPSNLWFVETMIKLFSIAGDLVDSDASQNLLRLIAEGIEENDDDDETERENAKMRKRAGFLLFEALRKPHVSEVLMKCAFWTLGEYGFLLSTKLQQNGHSNHHHNKKSQNADDGVIRVEEDEEEDPTDDDETEIIPLENVLTIICDAIDRASVVNPSTKAYGISAISKITAQLGKVIPRAKESMEKHSLSRHTELQQRCREFLLLVNEPTRLPKLFPIDASCEDFDNVDCSFLNEFTDILRAAGAPEYQQHLRVTNDYDFDGGLTSSPASSTPATGAKVANLRFDAYEPPKIETVASTNPTPNSFTVDDLSSLVGKTSMNNSSSVPSYSPSGINSNAIQQQQQQQSKPNVKSVWGPKGYTGNLPTLGGAQPTPSPPPSAATATSATATAHSQPPYASTPDYDFGAAAAEEQQALEDLRPPPPPPKKPEISEKEKAAQALFSGLGGKSSSTSNKSKQQQQQNTSSSIRPVPTTHQQQQPQAKKVPPPPSKDLFSMEGDLLGVGNSTPTMMPSSIPTSTGPASTSTTDSLIDLFSTPMQTSFMTMPTTPITTTTSPSTSVLKPHQMDTQYFGSLWPSHSCDSKITIRTGSSFTNFIQGFSNKIGAKLVEYIPATQEAIFAGDIGPVDIVLIHAKDMSLGQVDLMIRSKQQILTDKVATSCRNTVF